VSLSARLRYLLVATTMMVLGLAPAAHAQTAGGDSIRGTGGSGGDGGLAVAVAAGCNALAQAFTECGDQGNADAGGGPGGGVVISNR
jgi:hypothetical protein